MDVEIGKQWRITRSLSSGVYSRDPLANPPYELRTHTATFGFAYKFDWGSQIVAKY